MTAATSARTVVANTKAIVSTPARIAASKAAVARRARFMVAMSGRAMPTVARLRAARKDAGNTPAMIVRMRAGNMPAALARTAAGSRAVTIASRIAVVNTTTTTATAVRRTPGIRRDDRRDGRFDGRREQGHTGRGDERHGQRAYQDGPSGQNRQGPVSTAAATTAISVERDGRPGAERRDGRPARIPVRRPATAVREGGQARASQPSRPRQPYAAIRIDQVQRVLGEILQWTYPADAALSHWLRGHPGLGARDRSEVAEAVYDVLRHLRRYRQYGESGVGPASRRLAILGLAATLGAQELAEGWTRPRPNGCSACRASIRPRCRARYGAAFPTGWTSVCPPWTARTR